MKKLKRALAAVLSIVLMLPVFGEHLIGAQGELQTKNSYDVAGLVNNIEIYRGETLLQNGDGIGFGDTLKVRYYLDTLYPNTMDDKEQNFEPGTEYDLPDIPKEITTLSKDPLELSIHMTDGTLIGTAKFTPGTDGTAGHVNITFDSGLKGKDSIHGVWLEFSAKLNKDECGQDQEKDLTFHLQSGTKVFNVKLTDNIPTDPELDKDGSYDSADNVINWSVTVTEGSKVYGKLRLDDSFGENQEYVSDSFKAEDPDGQAVSLAPSVNDNTLACEFTPKNVKGKVWKVSYQTKLKGNAIVKNDQVQNGTTSVNAQNTAKLYDSENDQKVKEASKTVKCDKEYKWIEKVGTLVTDPSTGAYTGEIDWKLKVNANGYTFDNAVVYDKVTGTPVNSGSKICYEGTAVSGSGSHTQSGIVYADEAGKTATAVTTQDSQTYSMKVNLGTISGSDSTEITYRTRIDNYEEYIQYNQPTIKNTAWMTFEWPDYDGTQPRKIGVPSLAVEKNVAFSAISKSDGIYNKASHEIEWKVTVNGNKAALKDVTVKDIPGAYGNQTSGDDSQVYTGYQDLEIDGVSASIADFIKSSNDNETVFDFGNELNGHKATFTVTTKLKDRNYFENNISENDAKVFYNKAELYTGSTLLTSDDGKVKPTNTVLEKKEPSYDYASHTLSWMIGVNKDQMELKGPVMRDVIPKGLLLDKSTLRFLDGTVIPEGNAGDTKPYYTYEENTQKLTVYLEDFAEGDSSKTICFDTKVDVDHAVFDGKAVSSYNGDITVENQAELAKTSSTNTVSDEASVKIKNQLLNKSGVKDESDGDLKVSYEIVINQPGAELPAQTCLTDILSPGLSLNLPSLKLYEASVASDGTVTAETSKPVTDFTYDTQILGEGNLSGRPAGSTMLTLKLPDPPGRKTYVLRYNAVVADSGRDSYENHVSMTGADPNSSGNRVNLSKDQLVGGGGGSSSSSSRVELTKYDVDTDEPVKDAVFTLSYDGHAVDEKTTGQDGKLTFNGLEPGYEYMVTEKTPAQNYRPEILSVKNTGSGAGDHVNLEQDQKSFKVTAPERGYSKRLQFSVANEKYKTKLSFKKVDENGAALSGAQFELYAADAMGTAEKKMDVAESDTDGNVLFGNVIPGNYVILESKAPDGYLLSSKKIIAAVSPVGQAAEFYIEGDSSKKKITEFPDDPKPAGTAQFLKTDDADIPLSDAVFTIFKVTGGPDNTTEEKLQTVKSARQGSVRFDGLKQGTYYIRETETIKGYEPSNDTLVLVMDEQGLQKELYLKDDIAKEAVSKVVNVKKPFSQVSFQSEGMIYESCSDVSLGAGNPKDTKALKGSEFTFYELDSSGKETGRTRTAVSDGQGAVSVDDLPWGRYKVKQTGTLSGYEPNKEVYYLEAGRSGTTGLLHRSGEQVQGQKVVNEVYRTDIVMKKVNEKNIKQPVAGSTYGLYRQEETGSRGARSGEKLKLIAKAVTDKDGQLVFKGVLMNVSYTIRELEAPDGSYRSANPVVIRFTRKADGSIAVSELSDGDGTAVIDKSSGGIVWKEPPVEVKFYKTDEKGNLLEGAKLEVRNSEGDVVERWTSKRNEEYLSSGKITAGETYYLTETKAPEGYKVAEPVKFQADEQAVGPEEGRIVTVTMVDKAVSSKIRDTGTKKDNGKSGGGRTAVPAETGDSREISIWILLLAGAIGVCVAKKIRRTP